MRIVAGQLRGRRLTAPEGTATRPTSDRVREAVFAMLGDIEGVDVLDLFAGSGAMALEALSRGAGSAVCVDSDPAAVRAIRANAGLLDDPGRLLVRRSGWKQTVAALERSGRTFGLCLVDPPYSLLPRILGELADVLRPVLSSGARIVIEGGSQQGAIEVPGFRIASRTDRTYGSTAITILRIEATE